MAKPRKGVVPPQLRPYLFKKGGARKARRTARRAARTSSRGARRTARRRRRGGSHRQGIASWLTSILALLIGLFPAWQSIASRGGDIGGLAADLNNLYNPLGGDRASLQRGYGSIVGGIVFKAVTGELVRRARVKSIIPALRA
jgi:hypothetical protein